jgi:hypothetical protein
MIDTDIFPWRSQFRYGPAASPTTWETKLPVRPWSFPTRSIGGQRTAGGGTPAGYVVRQDYVLAVPVRLYETELPALTTMIVWLQAGAESFTWWPNANQPANFEVYLEAPKAGVEWREERDGTYGRLMVVNLEFRRVDGYAWDLDYFACP